MRKSLLVLLTLIASPALAQVEVRARLDKPEHLAGEPVFVILELRNTGTEAFGREECMTRMTLDVIGAPPRMLPGTSRCLEPESVRREYLGCGTDHPRLLQPGATAIFEYLLRGYDLPPGEYQLRAVGTAGVRWKYYPDLRANAPPPPPRSHRDNDPVEGAGFDATLRLVIRPATIDMLTRAFAPYVAAASSSDPRIRVRSQMAIAEMAPPFLEQTIAGFAAAQFAPPSALDALARINTKTSRAALIALFDASTDLRFRETVVWNVARTGQPDTLDFLASLLAGRSTEYDDRIRRPAALGLGRIGGRAAAALVGAPHSPNGLLRSTIASALGNTGSRQAVPALIERYADESARNEVCWSLLTLTHRT